MDERTQELVRRLDVATVAVCGAIIWLCGVATATSVVLHRDTEAIVFSLVALVVGIIRHLFREPE